MSRCSDSCTRFRSLAQRYVTRALKWTTEDGESGASALRWQQVRLLPIFNQHVLLLLNLPLYTQTKSQGFVKAFF